MQGMFKAVGIKLVDFKLEFGRLNQDEKTKYLDKSKVLYFKKVVKPTDEEIKKHKEFLKKNLKKNFFN